MDEFEEKRRLMLTTALGIGAGVGLTTLAARPQTAAAQPASPTSMLSASSLGVKPNSPKVQTKELQKAIQQAAKEKRILWLESGTYLTGALNLPDGSFIEGIAEQTILKFAGGARLLSGEGITSCRLVGITIDGANKALSSPSGAGGLVLFKDITNLVINNCRVKQGLLSGFELISCGGQVRNCHIHDLGRVGLFSLDSRGLEIAHNHIHNIGNNGIQIWRSSQGADGTLVINNRIENIKARAGGTGQNGNGINIFRANGVHISGNHITDCEFSAIRNNAGNNCQITNNHCRQLGEVAIYAEFGFEGAMISGNLVDGAHVGISITNFNDGGRLAVANGNLIRNIKKRKGERAIGIAVEADSAVIGNVIEQVDGVGIGAGWGKYLRDVTIGNNLVRQATIGIGLSSDPEAGFVMVSGNMIRSAKQGSIRAMDLHKPIGPDLGRESSESFPNFAIFNNVGI